MKQQIKRLVGRCYTPRLRHAKRRLEVRFLNKGERELALLHHVLDRDQVAFDVGANVGDYLNVLARHSRRAIAFEPHPDCFAYLSAVGIANCTVLNLALSDRAGTAVLRVPVQGREITGLATIAAGNERGAEASARSYEVEVMPLDEAAARYLRRGERVGFIKIDVEGHEHAVLAGAQATIAAHRPIVMLETEFRHGAPIPEIFALFAARGYVARILRGGRMEDVDAARLARLQQDADLGDAVLDSQDSFYPNNIWFAPGERLASVARLGRDGG